VTDCFAAPTGQAMVAITLASVRQAFQSPTFRGWIATIRQDRRVEVGNTSWRRDHRIKSRIRRPDLPGIVRVRSSAWNSRLHNSRAASCRRSRSSRRSQAPRVHRRRTRLKHQQSASDEQVRERAFAHGHRLLHERNQRFGARGIFALETAPWPAADSRPRHRSAILVPIAGGRRTSNDERCCRGA
jgi:hypothetical protein